MKLQSIIAALAALLSAGSLSAAVITPQQALERASNGGPAKVRAIARQANPELLLTVTDKVLGEPGCYVFASPAGRGFMVLSADDAAVPVLGYSDSEQFNADDMPDNLRYWLDCYAEEIAAAREAAASSPTIIPMGAARPARQAIAPLVTTKWDQSAPYNYKCPKVGTKRCVTGCTATAFAQVVNYYKHPATHGTGTHSYSWASGGQTLTFDYANTTFDWNNMLNVYSGSEPSTSATAKAVATLMYACGVAADMNYGTGSSGGFTSRALSTMKECMGFSANARIEKRSLYGLVEWENIVYDNLKNYGPMVYTGYNQTYNGAINVGHSFVCDGYSADGYFHINWGWSGMSDGYYLLSSLDPESQGTGGSTSGYNFNQEALLKFCPAKAGETEQPYYGMYLDSDFIVSQSSVSLGSYCTFKLTAWSNSSANISSATLGARFEAANGTSVTSLSTTRLANLPPNYGVQDQTISVQVPRSLTAGTYHMYPGFQDGYGNWHDLGLSRNFIYESIVTVSGSRASFSTPAVVVPEGPAATLLSPIYSDYFFEAEFNLTNTADAEYYGNVVPALLHASQNSIVATAEYMTVNLLPGESKQIKGLTMFQSINPGNYRFCLISVAGEMAYAVTDPIAVTVKAAPTGQFKITNSLPNISAKVDENGEGIVDVSFTLNCTSGINTIYNGLMILNNTYSELKSHYHYDIPMSEGVNRTFTYSLPINDVSPTKTYYLGLFIYYDSKWDQREMIPFSFTFTSGVDDVEAEAQAPIAVELYDLAGRRIDSANPAPGHYLQVSRYADGTSATSHRLIR